MKKEKYFFGDFPLSRFLTKALRVNKLVMKKFLKNLSFRVEVKNYRTPYEWCEKPGPVIQTDEGLLTYLIGHNNPINGFRPAATLPSRSFCSLRAYASWLHQSMTGLLRFDPSNGYKIVFFTDFHRSPHQIPVSLELPPPYERNSLASAAAEY